MRAASGGESRLIRATHGDDAWYTRSAWRALELWRELEQEAGVDLFVPCGVAWFFDGSRSWADASAQTLASEGVPHELLEPDEARHLFPSFDPQGLGTVLYEPASGVLRARDATRTLAEQAIARGTRFEQRHVSRDERFEADAVIWACGPWLAQLFPDLLQLEVTRQDVFFFGSPPEWQAPSVPAWVDFDEAIYGVGDVDGRGFKASPDRHGPQFDPDRDDRAPSPETERVARAYLERRFPALADAPIVGTRSCPYSLTPDQNFVIAPRPDREHEWLLGGGSGHGFKHGPALAEYLERLLTGDEEPDPRFGLERREPAAGFRTREL